MKKYYVEYKARLWIEADNMNEAREKANAITNKLELIFPDVERV